jgi:asparagine synthase (glutamine-hydrolysing)
MAGSRQAGAPAGEARGSALDAALRKDVLTGNLRAVLALTDRNAMAHSIEARVPYVDRHVVEFAFQLPDRYKIGQGKRKLVLRKLGAARLPGNIVTRVDRIGFGAPTHQWLLEDFRPELKALADGPVFHDAVSIDNGKLKQFVDDFLSGGHDDAGTIWRLYAVDLWARAYGVTGI